MSKVTSKLQLTLPKALAEQFRLRPGDEVSWVAAGDSIRLVPASREPRRDPRDRAALFDAATKRQAARNRARPSHGGAPKRGWAREDLYDRGRAR